jgi:hypothetical protein
VLKLFYQKYNFLLKLKLIEISKTFFHENQLICLVKVVEYDKNIKNKFDVLIIFDHIDQKWPFLATFGKIAISQPKRIQIKKKGPVRISKD